MPFTNFQKTFDVMTPKGTRQASVTFGPLQHEWNIKDFTGTYTFARIADAQRHLDGLGQHATDLLASVTKFAREHRRPAPTPES
jgi:hypothetical protein